MPEDNLKSICDEIQNRRQLSDASMVKYRQKIKKFSKLLVGENTPILNLHFLKHKTDDLMKFIEAEPESVSRTSASCLLGCILNKNGTPVCPSFDDVIIRLRTHMELKNQQYVDKKKIETHSQKTLDNWVNISCLKKYQRKMLRDALEMFNRAKKKGELTWSEMKVIQKATIVSLYINYRKAGEQYPAWFKQYMMEEKQPLPSTENESLIAPKRLEWADFLVVRTDTQMRVLQKQECNIVYSIGLLSRHKKLWLGNQKNTKPHYEHVNNILNKALNLQLSAVELYINKYPTHLLILKQGEKMNKNNLSSWISQSFEPLGVELTANQIRHIISEETGINSEEKKLIKEQLNKMNHSSETHDLAYST